MQHGGQALRPQMPKSEEAAFIHVVGCDVIATVVVVGAACLNGSAPSLAEPTRGPCRISLVLHVSPLTLKYLLLTETCGQYRWLRKPSLCWRSRQPSRST